MSSVGGEMKLLSGDMDELVAILTVTILKYFQIIYLFRPQSTTMPQHEPQQQAKESGSIAGEEKGGG